jgi:hypothetical protein
MSESNAVDIIKHVRAAFEWRVRPNMLTASLEMSAGVMEDLGAIASFNWYETTGDIWEKYFDVYCYFSAEAFCYYLPGIIKVSLEEQEPNLIAVSSIISDLDRSCNQDGWDDLFLARWPLLTSQELCVVQEWIWWLSSCQKTSHVDDSLMRSLETIELLKSKKPEI